jgi:hypothetical protein
MAQGFYEYSDKLMALLVSVIGAPTSGKSCLIKMFKERHNVFSVSIDEVRTHLEKHIEYKLQPWEFFHSQIIAALALKDLPLNCYIIESSGLSTRLPSIVWAAILEGHFVQTIHLVGPSEDFKERLRHRIQSPNYKSIPFEYSELTMEDLIDKCTDKLTKLWNDADNVYTGNEDGIGESYKVFESLILHRLEKLKVQ